MIFNPLPFRTIFDFMNFLSMLCSEKWTMEWKIWQFVESQLNIWIHMLKYVQGYEKLRQPVTEAIIIDLNGTKYRNRFHCVQNRLHFQIPYLILKNKQICITENQIHTLLEMKRTLFYLLRGHSEVFLDKIKGDPKRHKSNQEHGGGVRNHANGRHAEQCWAS